MMRRKSLWLWLLAFLLTLLVSVYQRLSGPTYPIKGGEILAGTEVSYKFYRSWTSGRSLPVRIAAGDGVDAARLHYRRYPWLDNEEWTSVALAKKAGEFLGVIPSQPRAGKVAYRVDVSAAGRQLGLNNGRPVVARFKGEVPAALLIVHILFMFGGLLLAFRTGMESLRRDGRWQRMVPWTLAVVCIGGLFLGPLVQKYAFGAFWTGFPFGYDLTDNKTLLAAVCWLVAFSLRKKSRWWTVAATAIMVVVYLIPHSVLGSELDYTTGKVGTSASLKIN